MAPCMNPLVSISDMYTHFMDLLPNLIALHIFQTTWKFLSFFFFFLFFGFFVIKKIFIFKIYISYEIWKDNFVFS
jgi:hypothetical protein